jgi:hypothetical protein
MITFLIALGLAAAWVASLVVRPFGRCWMCDGKGNIRRRGRRRRRSARCVRA